MSSFSRRAPEPRLSSVNLLMEAIRSLINQADRCSLEMQKVLGVFCSSCSNVMGQVQSGFNTLLASINEPAESGLC